MKTVKAYITSKAGKSIIASLLLALLLNNIVIPEMERLNPLEEIPNNASNILEIVIEGLVESDLFEAHEEDDSSDNLADGLQKYLPNNLHSSNYFLPTVNINSYNIAKHLKSSKGFQNIDLPPPKLL